MTFSCARLPGQTPLGIFSNVFNRIDRIVVGGWYLAIHVGPWRAEWHTS